MKRILTTTADGSATLYVPELDEHYHSVKGAHTESIHIFIQMGMHRAIEIMPQRPLRIFEVGFGTGLNALLTLQEAERLGVDVHYVSAELYPLAWEEIQPLGYSQHPLFEQLHQVAWEEDVPMSPHFTLRKVQGDVRQMPLPTADVVYFDAFAPEKQPELWEEDFLQRLFKALSPGAVLTTYCAKGEVRRRLQRAGFGIERLPGPPGGKREILRATVPFAINADE